MIKAPNRYNTTRSFKDHYQERKLLIKRSIVAFAFVAIMLMVLLIRSWYLQVVLYDDYQTRSNDNRISVQPIAPKRGLIYDRNGVLLAENRSIYSLAIIPEKAGNVEETLERLNALALIDEKDRARFLETQKGQRRFKSLIVKNHLSEDEVARFSVDSHQFPGVRVEARLIRFYPYGSELVHALGYVGRINDLELAQIDQSNYRATRHIGKVGLEKYYESILHGTVGFRRVETDVRGRVIGKPLFEKPPVPGSNLRLAMDIRLQKVAAQAMGNKRGSVVAVDPRDGGVLLLVSNPGYDPNEFVTGISSANYRKLTSSEARPLFNRALRGLYSPGSTIKPHLGWIGLETGVVTPETTVYDPGYWVIPNEEQRVYRDWNPRGHGAKVDLQKAIVQSCDPYFYNLAYRMGIDTLSVNMQNFGFGDFTGIDMGEEVPGIMPSRDWKRRNKKLAWFPGETVITGIGQGYWIATPLQLANSIAQLGIAGTRFQLRMVSHIQDQGHELTLDNESWHATPVIGAALQADFSNQSNIDAVHLAMRKVTQYPEGTAKKAFFGAPYASAGKTGTVQLVTQSGEDYDQNKVAKKLHDNAVYVGYAPYDSPQIALAVVLENEGHGGEVAAPIARQIFDEFFKNQAADKAALNRQEVPKAMTTTKSQSIGQEG
ncbi:penicillin-binding protein 2 [Aliikangiella maris]|uniref:Penicillin-binding protein 2 n=2 Tax=Aliikangiella maris TaxID=3162458 RepID=A0ABV2BXZ1_9GAMM